MLSRELHRRGMFPPIDVLPSLSRLMNAGIGTARRVPEHREWADQLYAVYARGREARLMAAIVGESGLPAADRRALEFADRFETRVRRTGHRATHDRRHHRMRLAPAGDAATRGSDAAERRDLGAAIVSAMGLAPTRLNLVRAVRRLERLSRGAAVLRRKREALVTELFHLARPAADAREQISAAALRAYPQLAGALAQHGQAGVRAIGWPGRD